MNDYRKDKNDRARLLQSKVRSLAPLLGGDYVKPDRDDNDSRAQVNLGADGAQLAFYLASYGNPKNQVQVAGHRPTDILGGQHYRSADPASIHVSLDRPLDALARDIKRRFLDPYLVAYAVNLASARKNTAEINQARRVTAQLANTVGDSSFLSRNKHSHYGTETQYVYGPDYVKFEVSRGHIKFEASSLTEAQAMTLARMFRRRGRGKLSDLEPAAVQFPFPLPKEAALVQDEFPSQQAA